MALNLLSVIFFCIVFLIPNTSSQNLTCGFRSYYNTNGCLCKIDLPKVSSSA